MWLQKIAYHASNLKKDDEHRKPFCPIELTVCSCINTTSHQYECKIYYALAKSFSECPRKPYWYIQSIAFPQSCSKVSKNNCKHGYQPRDHYHQRLFKKSHQYRYKCTTGYLCYDILVSHGIILLLGPLYHHLQEAALQSLLYLTLQYSN